MHENKAIRRRRAARHGRWLAGSTCALVLAGLLSGSAAAFQMPGDYQGGGTVTVEPVRLPADVGNGWLRAKLRTTAGYEVLVRG